MVSVFHCQKHGFLDAKLCQFQKIPGKPVKQEILARSSEWHFLLCKCLLFKTCQLIERSRRACANCCYSKLPNLQNVPEDHVHISRRAYARLQQSMLAPPVEHVHTSSRESEHPVENMPASSRACAHLQYSLCTLWLEHVHTYSRALHVEHVHTLALLIL